MSTSSVGRDELRKPLWNAYMVERRTLLGCTTLVAVALIVWIVAISTDHWSIISGEGGIFMPENRRYFLWSHSGIWQICRYSTTPSPLANTSVARNLTSLAFQNASLVNLSRFKLAQEPFIEEFLVNKTAYPVKEFDENLKKNLFAHWARNNTKEFKNLKAIYREHNLARYGLTPGDERPIEVDTVNSSTLHEILGKNLSPLTMNGTQFYVVIPTLLRDALFTNWEQIPAIPPLLWAMSRDMEVPTTILNQRRTVLQLTPPKPPRKGRFSHGYEFVPFQRCKLIEMFPTEQLMRTDPSIDEEILDLVRTQASFAVITVMVMVMGFVFSVYTFMNPRYMFKRLAGGIHFISAAANLVVIQVFIAGLEHQRKHITFSYPPGSDLTYGYGIYFAWFVSASNLFSGVMFMWYSKKKKGNKAPCEELVMVDEAVNIGR